MGKEAEFSTILQGVFPRECGHSGIGKRADEERWASSGGYTGSREQVPNHFLHRLLAPSPWELSFHSSQVRSAQPERGPANTAGWVHIRHGTCYQEAQGATWHDNA